MGVKRTDHRSSFAFGERKLVQKCTKRDVAHEVSVFTWCVNLRVFGEELMFTAGGMLLNESPLALRAHVYNRYSDMLPYWQAR